MNQTCARLQDASRDHLPILLAVYILCQPLLDVVTGLGAAFGQSITAGVVVRSLFMALAFLYAVFVSDYPGKKRVMIFTGVLVGYLMLFMLYMFSIGGLSLCIGNMREVVKTFFIPFVLVFLWSVYRQYGYLVTADIIALAGGLYASVIPIAVYTRSSFYSYGSSGYGARGWFYAANEVGCVMALTTPFTIWYCLQVIPTVTKKTWWKGALAAWALIAVAYSANFLGTKIIFGAIALYCVAALVWQAVRLAREPSREHKIQAAAMVFMLLLVVFLYFNSPLQNYLAHIYRPLMENDPELVLASWGEEIERAADGTWLYEFIKANPTMKRVDQILSRRFISASPAVQVYTEGGLIAKLLGIGYANAAAYSRKVYYMVEMDPLAILVRHGIVGFAVYYGPYLAFLAYMVVQFFRRTHHRMSSLGYCTALYCSVVGFGISIVAGHALVSPAVATFILVVAIQLWAQTEEQNKLSVT